jgi:hypothetical protein
MEEKFLDILHTIEEKIRSLKEVTVHEVELIAYSARHDIGRLVEKAKAHIKLGHTTEHLEGLQPPPPPAPPVPNEANIVDVFHDEALHGSKPEEEVKEHPAVEADPKPVEQDAVSQQQ